MEAVTTSQLLVGWAIATATAIAVFLHANKHGSRHATAWGIGVFLALIVFLPAYLVKAWHRKQQSER